MKWCCLVALLLAIASNGQADDKVPFEHYKQGYFEKNNSGLKGEPSLLALTTRDQFDAIFGFGRVLGKLPLLLPTTKDEFAKLLVLAVITRGDSVTTYTIESVTADGAVLTVKYKSDTPKGNGTAKYASPMILSVARGKYTSVLFVENGKTLGKVTIDP